MTTMFGIQVILAVLAVLFVSYGLLHEDKFVAFEDMIIRVIKKKVYLHRRRKAIEKRRKQGSYATSAQRQQYQTHSRTQGTQSERRRVA